MWIIIATVCSSLQADSCTPAIWKEKSFVDEKQCTVRMLEVIQTPPPGTAYIFARCVPIPGQMSS